MKKVLLTIIVLVLLLTSLFVLTGCEKQEAINETKVETVEPPKDVDPTIVKINNLEFHVNKEAEFHGLNYIVVPDFKEVNQDMFTPYVQYNHLTDDGNLLYFRIFYYEGKPDTNSAIEDLGIQGEVTLSDGKNDNLEYKFYGPAREDGGTMHYYFIEHEGSTFALTFTSKYDIKDFEEKVVKSLKF